jgi:NTE family protein
MGVYTRELGTDLFSTYLGASLELGNVWRDSDDIDFDSLLGAGSLFLGAKTFLGPLYLGYGHAQGGRNALYFILGRPWTGSAFTD